MATDKGQSCYAGMMQMGMRKGIQKGLIVFAVIVAMISFVVGPGLRTVQTPPPEPATPAEPTGTTAQPALTDNIHIASPLPDSAVTSPLDVRGEARGMWFFEASFPVRLLDGNGNEIARTAAKTGGNWMTTDFVPFDATLTFAAPSTASGTLVLKRDNPSGEPANDAEVRVPVRFIGKASAASGIAGRVLLGPTCPVERIPPDPQCAPKPYPTSIGIFVAGNPAAVYRTITTDAQAAFRIELPPGTYTLVPRGGAVLPRCGGQEAVVTAGRFTDVSLSCDTGIR